MVGLAQTFNVFYPLYWLAWIPGLFGSLCLLFVFLTPFTTVGLGVVFAGPGFIFGIGMLLDLIITFIFDVFFTIFINFQGTLGLLVFVI